MLIHKQKFDQISCTFDIPLRPTLRPSHSKGKTRRTSKRKCNRAAMQTFTSVCFLFFFLFFSIYARGLRGRSSVDRRVSQSSRMAIKLRTSDTSLVRPREYIHGVIHETLLLPPSDVSPICHDARRVNRSGRFTRQTSGYADRECIFQGSRLLGTRPYSNGVRSPPFPSCSPHRLRSWRVNTF